MSHDDNDEHDLGFARDRRLLLPAVDGLSRRTALGLFTAGATGLALLGCSSSASAATTAKTPSETAGPYPADGSNGPDVLDDSGIVRRDIRRSFGGASGRSNGVNLTIALKIVHAATSKPYPHAAVYLWHCDQRGRYSLYSSGATHANFLRGIQVADSNGRLRFRSIFPGCYSGRWPHIHFEVYPTLRAAHHGTNRVLTSQIALPKRAAQHVYRDSRYSGSAANLSQTSLSSDMVFGDGWSRELATMSGTIGHSYTASLTVAV